MRPTLCIPRKCNYCRNCTERTKEGKGLCSLTHKPVDINKYMDDKSKCSMYDYLPSFLPKIEEDGQLWQEEASEEMEAPF